MTSAGDVSNPLVSDLLGRALRDSAVASAAVSNYCDHAEHNETVDRAWVLDAGETLRRLALEFAGFLGNDAVELYVARVDQLERDHPTADQTLRAAANIGPGTTWRQLQLSQTEHDRIYHPDVFGMSRSEQLRHYALHLSKLAGAIAELPTDPARWDDFRRRRLPDLLLFGVKLASVMGERLPDEPVAHPQGDVSRRPGGDTSGK